MTACDIASSAFPVVLFGGAVSTVRPIVGIFFACSGLAPQVFFGTAFWLGFTLHLLAAEIWINYTRSVSKPG